jgi:hypothetical protein
MALAECPKCGYDLTGLPAPHRCPECGFKYDEQMRAFRLRRGINVGAVIAGALLAAWFLIRLLYALRRGDWAGVEGSAILLAPIVCWQILLVLLRGRTRTVLVTDESVIVRRGRNELLRISRGQIWCAEYSNLGGEITFQDRDGRRIACISGLGGCDRKLIGEVCVAVNETHAP